MKRDQLLKYCQDQKILIPKDASLDQLNAAIFRASMHKVEIKKESGECFGYWEKDNNVCVSCNLEEKCFTTAHGIDKKTYFKKLENLENPKLRVAKKRIAKFTKARI